ncbi:MAG: TIGR03936 family radical SAM-associated protein [Bacillota bacterium]
MIKNSMDIKKTIVMRLKFTKGNEVKYISHLDLMRAFQRAIRRSDIPVSYSAGFNPHQELSFGAPLSLGVTSDAEYVDIKLAQRIEPQTVVDKLNEKLPVGIKIHKGTVLSDKAKSAMAIVTHSIYTVRMTISGDMTKKPEESFAEFLAQNEIYAMKKQPKKDFELKEIDIKPMITGAELMKSDDDIYLMKCLLQSGSKANLKPELLIKAFSDFSGYDIKVIRINREELYVETNDQLLDLLQYAEKERQ